MPLTDDEWRAFVNESNGAMGDAEADLAALLENARLGLRDHQTREGIPISEADAVWETIQEGLHKVQDRLNAHARRLLRMREAGEL